MRRLRALAILGLVIALSIVATGTPAIAKKPRSEPVVLSDDQLLAAMLSISDMPTGWSGPGATDIFAGASATDGPCGGPNEAARGQNAGALFGKGIGFAADPQAGPYFGESLYVFPTKKAAKLFVGSNRALLTTCPSFPDVDGFGNSVMIMTTEVSFPRLGDEVVALRFAATVTDPDLEGIGFSNDQIYVRQANYVFGVGQSVNGGLGASPGDPELNEKYARLALSKLGVAIQQAKRASKAATTTKTD